MTEFSGPKSYIKKISNAPWLDNYKIQKRTLDGMQNVLYKVEAGNTLAQAAKESGVTLGAVENWRSKYPEYDAVIRPLVDANQEMRRKVRKERVNRQKVEDGLVFDPSRPMPDKGTFAEMRWKYLGRPTKPHHVPMAAALEDRTNLVVIILAPPGAGKDTIAGDWILYEHMDDREGLRTAWFMESENFSKRRLGRLGKYLTDPTTYNHKPTKTPDGQKPEASLILDYGPFKWEKGMIHTDGEDVERPTWTKHQMYFLQSIAPESDPSLWATGIGGSTYGSRIDNAVVSDAFTEENQSSPTVRLDQQSFIEGTFESRLDESGRAIFIGTMLEGANNYTWLIDTYTEGARVVSQDGYYTKYSNGTAVVVIPAIQVDDDGNEVSYWPERFPLDDYIVVKGKRYELEGLTPEQEDKLLSRPGARRIRGLLAKRERNPTKFAAMYQQERQDAKAGDFTESTLQAARDMNRTFGIVYPNEIAILGVDPARRYGAAWVLWAVNRSEGTVTLADYGYYTNLGIDGIKNKLLLAPMTTYLPLWLCFEVNRYSAVLEDYHIKQAIRDHGVSVLPVTTTGNQFGRGSRQNEFGPASLAPDMRAHTIRFPAKTAEDVRRLKRVEEHFMAWDSQIGRTKAGKSTHTPDDIAMAAWAGYIKAREILHKGRGMGSLPAIPVPPIVAQKWKRYQKRQERTKRIDNGNEHHSAADLITMFAGGD